jgi:transcriptional regulator with XRE-family HTH domain
LTLIQFISTYRKLKGYTQEILADELNISPNTLSQYETGARNIPSVVLAKFCEVLNFTIVTRPKEQSIRIIFENDEIESLIHREIKKKYGITINFAINNDDEYPENVLLEIYEEDNDENEMEKLEEEFGENIFSGFNVFSEILVDILNHNDVSAWNIGETHEGYPEYNEKFRTIVELSLEN